MYKNIKYLVAGERALVMEFGNQISKDINSCIRSSIEKIETAKIEGIVELIPTYRSITVSYDPMQIKRKDLVEKLKQFEVLSDSTSDDKVRLIEIPTLYGGEFGPDIDFVAKNAGISPEEVIKIHSGTDYLVYMMGFTPGFTYLGGLDERIATPRLKSPRLKIVGGSVGIAGSQTGMYPSDSPGGWQLIGRTPVKLYDKESDKPVFINAGDYIRYVSISQADYDKIQEQVQNKTYQVVIKEVSRGELNG